MSALSFHAEIYSAAGIQAALDAFADFGTFAWSGSSADGYHTVTVQAAEDVDAVELQGEFSNFALARSLESAGR